MNFNKYKFIASVIGLFLVPFLVLSNHFLNINRERIDKDALNHIRLRTKTVSERVSDVLNSNYDVFRAAKDKSFVKLSLAGRKKFLEGEIKKHRDIYKGFSVFTPGGKKLLSVGDMGKDTDLSVLLKGAAQSLSVGAVEYSDDEPCALIAAEPIFSGKSKKPKLIIIGKLSLAHLNSIIRSFGKNLSGELGIVDSGGQIISDSRGKSIINPGIIISNGVSSLINAALKRRIENSSSRIVLEDDKILIAVSSIAGTKWWVYEKINTSRLVNRSRWAKKVVRIGIFLILVFGFISYKLAQRWLICEKPQVIDEDKRDPSSSTLGTTEGQAVNSVSKE